VDLGVLLIPGNLTLANLGDNVMLVVAAQQLGQIIPGFEARVVTRDPGKLARLLPEAQPVAIGGQSGVPGGLADLLRRSALLRGRVRRRRYLAWTRQVEPALHGAQAVVLSGQGVLTDAFAHEAIWRLELMERAHRLGKPTALFSQGLGMVTVPHLATTMRRVLPQIDLLVTRNDLDAERLRTEFGCPVERVRAGGDDALAYPHLQSDPAGSTNLGLSVRLADYAGTRRVPGDRWMELKRGVQAAAQRVGAGLMPVPVEAGDLRAVESLFGLAPKAASEIELDELERRVAGCRVVVTGSYHSAVFALAMGVPAICLVFSEYYRAKFSGLAGQYPEGCVTFDMRSAAAEHLSRLIHRLWNEASELEPKILSTTQRLVERNLASYREFARLLGR